MFTIIAERINMTRKRVREEVWKRNVDFVTGEVRKQVSAGATHIDINAGGDPAKEVEDMRWLAEIVSKATDLPIVFDSTNPVALEEGLKLCNREGTIINSITGERERIESILPLVKKYETGVIALTMDDDGMPEDFNGRMKITRKLAETFKEENISLDRVYFDYLVRPVSTNPGQAKFILDAIVSTGKEFPDAHIALGLSNISFGLPARNNLNKVFLAMLIAAGCDGLIFDPCEEGMMNTLLSAKAVAGLDEYCMEYITAYRAEKLK